MNSSFSQLHFFLQETLINTKTRHFHSSINHQEHIFHRTRISSYFCLLNIAKILRTDFLYTSRSSRLQISFKIGVLRSSAKSLFKKTYRLKARNFILKRLQHRCFPVRLTKFFKTRFLVENLQWLLLHLRWLLLYFFLRKQLNSYLEILLWRTNSFFFSTHRLMYQKSNSFVYKFVINC